MFNWFIYLSLCTLVQPKWVEYSGRSLRVNNVPIIHIVQATCRCELWQIRDEVNRRRRHRIRDRYVCYKEHNAMIREKNELIFIDIDIEMCVRVRVRTRGYLRSSLRCSAWMRSNHRSSEVFLFQYCTIDWITMVMNDFWHLLFQWRLIVEESDVCIRIIQSPIGDQRCLFKQKYSKYVHKLFVRT